VTTYTLKNNRLVLSKEEEEEDDKEAFSYQEIEDFISAKKEEPADVPLWLKAVTTLARSKTEQEKTDLKRVGLNMPVGTAKLFYDTVDTAQSIFTDEAWGDKPYNNFIKQRLFDSGMDEDTVNSLVNEEGKIKKVETGWGTAGEVASFVGVGAAVKKSLDKVWSNKDELSGIGKKIASEGGKSTLAGAGASQALSDPSYNMGNMLDDFLKDTENYSNGNIRVLAQALAAKEDDSVAMQRFRLLAEEPLFIALGFTGKKGIEALSWAQKKSIDMFGKPLSDLSSDQKGKVTASYFDGSKEQVAITSNEPIKVRADAEPKEIIEVPTTDWQKRVSFLSGTINRFFRSRGNFSQEAFDAWKGSEVAQRKWLARAEFIAANLQRSLDDIADATDSKETSDKVYEALNSNLDFLDEAGSQKERINLFAKEIGISTEIAEHTLTARSILDELSGNFSNVSLNSNVSEAISNNMGEYLRRSYRRYEDPDWKTNVPSDIYDNAHGFINESLQRKARKNKALAVMRSQKAVIEETSRVSGVSKSDIEKAIKDEFQASAKDDFKKYSLTKAEKTQVGVDATEEIKNILGLSDGKEWDNSLNHFANVKKLNQRIFEKRKDVPKAIRELLGEIEDPVESLVLSISKGAKFYENMKFYENFREMGLKGGYVFRSEDLLKGKSAEDLLDGKNIKKTIEFQNETYQIIPTGTTNSDLDGMYTTKHMLDALTTREEHWFNWAENPTYQKLLALKGLSQANKTVYSWTTNIRNISGGAQFGLANGINPFFSPEGKSVQTILAGIHKKGDEELVAKYHEYLGLGIINTNVRVNEFRKLIASGYEGDLKGIINSWESKLSDYGAGSLGKGLGKAARGAEHFYLAVDDFYKINAYEQELMTLKKAEKEMRRGGSAPVADLETLQNEAAEIVKSTFPTYDRVPPGIKALRELPFGNFISFPSEIIRTSGNIVRQASKEITSGSTTLRNRGLKRLAGFSVSTGAWGGLAAGSAMAMGWTDEQKKAADVLTETPWSKDSVRYFTILGDKMVSVDTQFIDSYSAFKEPLAAFSRKIKDGSLKGEALDTAILEASLEASKVLLKPYTDQSMLTELVTDVGYAIANPRGLTSKGKPYFAENQDAIESIWAVTADAAMTMMPGFVDNIISMGKAGLEVPKRGGTKPRYGNLQAEFLKNIIGVNFSEFDPEESLYFSARSFLAKDKAIGSTVPDWSKTGETLIKEHKNMEYARFENYQELYRKYKAGIQFYGIKNADIVERAFKKGGVSASDMRFIADGFFRPKKLSDKASYNIERKTRRTGTELPAHLKIYDNIREMSFTRLDIPLEEQLEERRKRWAVGGIVSDVPNVPEEPDERIDRMTGRPYNEQAGEAFIDNDDDPLKRMGFGRGGGVDPLQRLGFGKGGALSKIMPSEDVDTEWPKEGRDFMTVNDTWYWEHEKVPIKEVVKEALKRKAADPEKEDFIERMNFRSGGYVIAKGDTLGGIANELGFTIEELQELNKIKDPDKIFAGKTLKVPESVEDPEDIALEFSGDVSMALTDEIFSGRDIRKTLMENRESAIPVLKHKIPANGQPVADTEVFKASAAAPLEYLMDKALEDRPSGSLNPPRHHPDMRLGADLVAPIKAVMDADLRPPNPATAYLEGTKKTMNYLEDLGDRWWEARKKTQEDYEAGRISEVERDIYRVAGHISTVTTPVTDLFGVLLDATNTQQYVDKAVESISETEAAQYLAQLAEDNPRAAKNIGAVAEIIGIVPAVKVITRGFNRVAEGTTTFQQGFYTPGVTPLGKMAIVGKDFVTKIPSAVLDAFDASRSYASRITGLAGIKVLDEIREEFVDAVDKDTGLPIRNKDGTIRQKRTKTHQDVYASILTNEYIAWQSNVARGIASATKKTPLTLSNAYKFMEGWNDKEIKKQIFESMNKGGNLRVRVPDAVQRDALQHVKDVWVGKGKEFRSDTGVIIKRPDGPQKLGKEAHGEISQTSAPILGFLKNISSKDSNFKNISSEDFKDVLTSRDINFVDGPDDFIYIKTSHKSGAKEIGGVNDFIAIDTKKGDVFSLISDKHDIGKDIDPLHGKSLMTIQPMQSMNFRTGKKNGYRERDRKAENKAARDLQKETGIPFSKKQATDINNNKAGNNSAVNYQVDVIRKIWKDRKGKATVRDYGDITRRVGLLGSSTSLLSDPTEVRSM